MNKKLIFIIIILVAILAIIFVIQKNKKQGQVCFKNNCFDVELAITQEEQMQGLMFRRSLDKNKGMLFIFNEEGLASFWMKNTLIPLDIIWINKNKEVVFINENTQPCKQDPCPSISPDKKARYVLEINDGISKEIGLKVGDSMEIYLNKK
jgi:hypothetical protein